MFSRRWGALAFASSMLVTTARSASADDAPTPTSQPPPPPPTRGKRVVATSAALLPGLIVRGAGHWAIGEKRTARRLLVLEGVGLGLAALGGLPIGISGGAEETLPGLVLLIPAAGLLLTTVAADAWGAAGGACIAGTPASPPALEVAAGYTFVGDPRVPFANLATLDAQVWRGPVGAGASGWLGDGTWRARIDGAFRLRGPRSGERTHETADEAADETVTDTTAIDIIAAVAEERRAEQGLRVATGEVGAVARLDLRLIGPTLRGTFATLGMTVGAERTRYVASDTADTFSLFSGHIGWGFTLGDGRTRALETELYYEHRRDTLAGGLTPPLAYNGFIGYVGAVTTGWRGRYGASARLEVGSAYVVALAAHLRLPELP